ncbi:MAG: DUF6531 domain-containing protein, partial [Planctomycetota bacterium]
VEATQLFGYNSSALEHNIVEETISAESVSTMKGLQRAFRKDAGLNRAGDLMDDDRIFVFASQFINGVFQNAAHLENWYASDSGGSGVHPVSGRSGLTAQQLEELLLTGSDEFPSPLLKSHEIGVDPTQHTDLGRRVYETLTGGAPDGFTGTMRVLAPRWRTAVGDWIGAVYAAEMFSSAGGFMSFSIIADGGVETSGGFSGGYALAPPAELPAASFTYAQWAGDPVHVANGNMYRDEVDFVYVNKGVPLSFARHYDAQSDDDFGLGVGWMYSFGDLLYEEDPTDPANDNLVWLNAQGKRYVFTPNGAGYDLPPELMGEVEHDPGAAEFFVFKDQDGLEHRFEKMAAGSQQSGRSLVGRLKRIVDRNDHGVEVVYEAGDDHRRISYVADVHNADRRVTFLPPATGSAWIERVNNGSRAWSYFYTTVEPNAKYQLREVRGPLYLEYLLDNEGTLSGGNDRPTTFYEYHDSNSPGTGLISRITEPDGAWHEYEYFHNG